MAGCGMTSDAGHVTRADVSGIANAMKNAMHHAQINLDEVDYINAHGTAAQTNDVAETETINQVFGEHSKKLAVSSTKSMHGHALGASNAMELAATALSIHHSAIPPTANFTIADEKCNLDYVPNKARKQDIHAALSNSFASGGLNKVIALKKYT
jgi:nodulation protein E